MYFLYTLALFLYLVALFPVVVCTRLRRGKPIGSIAERFGQLRPVLNPDHERSIWVHAVSVGEVLAIRVLLSGLRETYPQHRLLLSTTTATGQQVARQLGSVVDGTFYAPFDLPPFVSRTLDRVAPELLVMVDTEIWPNLLRECRSRGVKTVLVNGRLSNRSYRGYKLAHPFMRRVLEHLDRACVQTEAWGQRFVDLGLKPECLIITGSLKFDALGVPATGADPYVADRVLPYFGFTKGRQVLIAASTLRGEEEPVLRAFRRIRSKDLDAVLIVAPRHPERFEEVYQVAVREGFTVARRTELRSGGGIPAAVVILDTIGELTRLFQVATLVFVGGSLVPAGGHNVLEPAIFGKAIVFGPYMENFGEIARLFVEGSAACQVRSARELEDLLPMLVADPVRRASLGAAARAMVDTNRGARHHSLSVIAELLPPDRSHRTIDARPLHAVP